MRELGRLDILVSNAAWQNRKESIAEVTEEELEPHLPHPHQGIGLRPHPWARVSRPAGPVCHRFC